MKLARKACQNQVAEFCVHIEQINHQLVHTLNHLNDRAPGKTEPMQVSESAENRPRPPVRESSLNNTLTVTNNRSTGKYSLPNTTKSPSSGTPSPNTMTTNQLMIDYDSLLSYLTLKYGSPGERESCLRYDRELTATTSTSTPFSPRWFRDTQYPYVCQNGTFPGWFHGNITRQ